MSDYTKSTNFTAKDALSSGNSLKVVRGSDFDTEFNLIAAAVASKYDSGDFSIADYVLTATLTSELAGKAAVSHTHTNSQITDFATGVLVSAPSKTGTGASGTWGISITGNSASTSYATTAGSATTATEAGSCTGNSATATKLSNDSGSPGSYSARGWVNFNGTGTVAIRASKNVSSITDFGAGDYRVNWTTAMGSANYATAISASADPSWGAYRWFSTPDGSFASYQLTGSVRVGYQSGLIDIDSVNVVAFV